MPLPLILPLVFYTGGENYTAQRQFWKLFGENSQLMKETLEHPFYLIEVDKLPEKAMTSHVFAGTMAFIMRKHFRTHLNQEISKIIGNLNTLEDCEHHRFVLELIKYMLNVDEEHTHINELIGVLHNQLSPAVEKELMSLAEKLIEQGMEKGKLEGKLEIAEKMLIEGAEPVFIAKITGLSMEQIKKLGQH